MSVFKIGAVSVASLGGVAGTVVLVKHLSSEKKIKSVADKLREEHFTPITSDSDGNTMLTKYNAKKGESGARFTSENTDVKLEDLKSSCKSALAEDSETSKNYSKSRRGCTVPKTLSSLLTDHGLTLLSLDAAKEDNKEDGEKLQKAYEASTNNRISNLNLGSVLENKGKNLKSKCGDISKKDSTEADFEALFDNLKGGCTKQEADKLITTQTQQ